MAEKELKFKLVGDSSSLKNSLEEAKSGVTGLGSKFKSFGKIALTGVGAIAGVTTALGAMAYKAGQNADAILDMASATGMTTDEVQQWAYVAEQAGVSQDQLNKAMLRSGMGVEEFQAKIEELQQIEDPVERARMGVETFGARAWESVAPVVDLGDSIDGLKEEAIATGAVMDGDALNGLNNFRASIDKLKLTGQALLGQFLSKFAPILDVIMQKFMELLPTIVSVIKNGFELIMPIVKVVIDIFKQLVVMIKDMVINNKEQFLSMWETIKTVMKQIAELIQIVWDGIKVLWDRYGNDILKIVNVYFKLIMQNVSYAIKQVKAIIEVVMGILTGDWSRAWEGIKAIVRNVLESMSNIVNLLFGGIVRSITNKINEIRNSIVDRFNNILNTIKGIASKIKNALTNMFKANIKLPKFSFSGSLNPTKWASEGMPKVKVRWNREGGIFTKPTMLQGVAEPSNPEAILPIKKLPSLLGLNNQNQNITIMLDSKVIGRAVGNQMTKDIRVRTGLTL